ncbi:hypothetical protein FRC02_005413 [Tulasnella sp. 418]|nr:hypothetical protein FRC02_005413 [Tulasnella sp. 418]
MDQWNRLSDWILSSKATIGDVQYRQLPGAAGGLVTIADISPEEIIAAIPGSILVNVLTIGTLYPQGLFPVRDYHLGKSATLNSTQALSLHVALNRHNGDNEFSIYFATIPRHFDDHPLTWLCGSKDDLGQVLLEALPESIKKVLGDVEKRFRKDWLAVRTAIARMSQFSKWLSGDCFNDFLWAWLIVNTRCIHYSLVSNDPQHSTQDLDLTLCPVIDLANHTATESQSCQVIRELDGSLQLIAPPNGLKKGDEVLLQYGAHSNTTLFTEYGFVIPRSLDGDGEDGGGEILIDTAMSLLFQERQQFPWIKSVLENRGYWNDWALYTHPPPAHPSFRVLPALRLLNLPLPSLLPSPNDSFVSNGDFGTDEVVNHLAKWEATILGLESAVSEENNQAVRDSLVRLCQHVLTKSEEGLSRMQTLNAQLSERSPWTSYAACCIETLWQEEGDVSGAVLQSLHNGLELE